VADAGEARVLGLDPGRDGPAVRRRTGWVPERLELPPWMRVADHFRFLAPFHPTWDAALAESLARRLDLDLAARMGSLSKGGRAKHALIAALAHRPELLLLDEPFSGLDPVARHGLLAAILGHLREEGRTVLLVSHSMPDLERAADRVVLLEEGRVRLESDLEELQRRARRVAVTLRAPDPWTPPGAPRVEGAGADLVLTYLDWDERRERALSDDPAVAGVRALPRDLDDVFRAVLTSAEGRS
jgi:ABC-2 type transport system ATP-binding protein